MRETPLVTTKELHWASTKELVMALQMVDKMVEKMADMMEEMMATGLESRLAGMSVDWKANLLEISLEQRLDTKKENPMELKREVSKVSSTALLLDSEMDDKTVSQKETR